MIKAKELRIGNLVFVNKKDPIKVESINDSGINLELVFDTDVIESGYIMPQYLIGEVEPIPLTEDWLLKFGFDRGIYWRKDWFEIQQSEDEFSLYIPDNYVGQEYGEPFKYVHQLMNLYFALTGTELELKNENPV